MRLRRDNLGCMEIVHDGEFRGVEVFKHNQNHGTEATVRDDREFMRQLVSALNTGAFTVESTFFTNRGNCASIHFIGPGELVGDQSDYTSVRLHWKPHFPDTFIQLDDFVSPEIISTLTITLEGRFDTPERVAALKALGFEEVRETE